MSQRSEWIADGRTDKAAWIAAIPLGLVLAYWVSAGDLFMSVLIGGIAYPFVAMVLGGVFKVVRKAFDGTL